MRLSSMEEKRMDQEYEIDLREIFFLLKRKGLVIIASALACALVGLLITMFFITPKYEASAKMIVNSRQEQTANITNDMINSAKNLVDTYSIIIKSDTVLDQVIEKLGLDIDYMELSKRVNVSAINSTQVMRVAVQDPDPEAARQIVSEITRIAPDIIKETVEAGSVKVISEARAGQAPVSPNKVKNTALAGLLGLIVSVAVIILQDMLNNTFKSDEDIRKYLDLAVLGVIPHVKMEE